MKLTEINRVKSISKEEFVEQYLKPQKPVVIEQLIGDWPAYDKWSLDYIKEVAGDSSYYRPEREAQLIRNLINRNKSEISQDGIKQI